ncbi:MAG TPA: hypothetical protein VG869_06520 [Acidimicrobiia bacterium]|nr:hypothetical protein [Acidimicrobiia bacterium]
MNAVAESNPRLGRVGAWMGVAFVVLFVAGTFAIPMPSDNKKTAEWAKWWTDSGHRAGAIVGAYLTVLGVLAFIWFASSLRDRFGEGGRLMFTFGSIFAALALVSVMVRVSIPGAKQFGSTPVPAGGDLARQFDQIGFALLLVAGALAAGLFVGMASHLARRSGTLPGWLTIAGYVVAVLQLVASFFFPFLLFLLWVLVASIVLLRRATRAKTTAAVSSG